MTIGRRAVNLMRAFNIRHGIVGAELDAPSVRYGSAPQDGISSGRATAPQWDAALRNYYRLMGWDEAEGRPLPETLSRLGLDSITQDLWGKGESGKGNQGNQ